MTINNDPSPAPETPHRPGFAMPIAAIVVLSLFTLGAYDLYPLFSGRLAVRRIEKIAAPGKALWLAMEELKTAGYAPVHFSPPGTIARPKNVFVYSRYSRLAGWSDATVQALHLPETWRISPSLMLAILDVSSSGTINSVFSPMP